MTPQEVTNDVLARMPKQNRLPELTDHENAEMYKKVRQAMRDHKAGKPLPSGFLLTTFPRFWKT